MRRKYSIVDFMRKTCVVLKIMVGDDRIVRFY